MLTTEQEVNIRKLATMIRGIKVAMLTTMAPDRTLRSRPMASQEADFDGTLWFFTQASSEKTSEIRQNPHVNASYVSTKEHHYVSLTGHATVVEDREKMQELWSPVYRAWFPQGLDDPELALMRVDVEQGEYWDMLSSSMVNLLELDRATAPREAV
jgi:general stress protein 26